MTDIIDFKKVKNNKKAKIISEDIETIIKIMTLSIDGLSFYKNYIQVMEVISSLQNNKTLLEIHLNKYKKIKDGTSKLEET